MARVTETPSEAFPDTAARDLMLVTETTTRVLFETSVREILHHHHWINRKCCEIAQVLRVEPDKKLVLQHELHRVGSRDNGIVSKRAGSIIDIDEEPSVFENRGSLFSRA